MGSWEGMRQQHTWDTGRGWDYIIYGFLGVDESTSYMGSWEGYDYTIHGILGGDEITSYMGYWKGTRLHHTWDTGRGRDHIIHGILEGDDTTSYMGYWKGTRPHHTWDTGRGRDHIIHGILEGDETTSYMGYWKGTRPHHTWDPGMRSASWHMGLWDVGWLAEWSVTSPYVTVMNISATCRNPEPGESPTLLGRMGCDGMRLRHTWDPGSRGYSIRINKLY